MYVEYLVPPWMLVEFWREKEERSDTDPPGESDGRRLSMGRPSATSYGVRHVM